MTNNKSKKLTVYIPVKVEIDADVNYKKALREVLKSISNDGFAMYSTDGYRYTKKKCSTKSILLDHEIFNGQKSRHNR